ncbi:MAG: integrase core domain-containing protein [Thermoplasmatales archaeon]
MKKSVSNSAGARHYIERTVNDYNSVRPHSSLNYLTPDEFEERIASDNVFRKKWLDKQIGRYKNVLLLEWTQKTIQI